jgi:hypothetical protein
VRKFNDSEPTISRSSSSSSIRSDRSINYEMFVSLSDAFEAKK